MLTSFIILDLKTIYFPVPPFLQNQKNENLLYIYSLSNHMVDLKSSIIEKDDGHFLIKVDLNKFNALSDFDKLQFIHERNHDQCWNKETYEIDFTNMNTSQRAICSLYVIVGDIDNGGFIQFFQNTRDHFFDEGKKAFKLIGDIKTLKLFEKAIEIYFRNVKFLSAEDLDAFFNEDDEKILDKLKDEFYKLDDYRDKLMYDFIDKNIDDFLIAS